MTTRTLLVIFLVLFTILMLGEFYFAGRMVGMW